MAFRSPISDFQLGNPLYVGATVAFYLADVDGAKTATPATLYAEATGSETALNPQTLDSEGKLAAPLYHDAPLIAEVVFQNNESHDTGVILPGGTWRDDWASDTFYFTGDFLRAPNGNIYAATQLFISGETIEVDLAAGNRLTPVFDLAAVLADIAGDKYDVAFSLTGKPSSGEVLFAHVFASSVTFPEVLSGSLAIIDVAATAEAVFSLTKNGVEFATLTFAAAGTSGTFTAASATVFDDGDVLRLVAPNPQDATLSTFTMTVTGNR